MRIGVLTSGGDAPGMNAAIRSVVGAALVRGYEVFGIYDGYKGLVEGNLKQFTRKDVEGALSKGGTILGTARLPEFDNVKVREEGVKQLEKFGIECVVVIGGDGTYRGAAALTDMGIKCIGLPGTIDNDIASTEYTIGFSTALNTAVDAIDKLRDTSSSHQRCSIIEIMGRDCGDLSIFASICCGAEYVITKETGFDKESLLNSLKSDRGNGRQHAIVVVAEHITDVHSLAKEVETFSGYESRATVLGYIQRGGKPTPEDRLLASRMGAHAVDLLEQDVYGVAVGIIDNKMTHTPFKDALKMTRTKRGILSLIKKIK